MSQENVELVHRAYDAFNRRDLDAFLGFIDPEVDFTSRVVQVAGAPEAGRFLVLDDEQCAHSTGSIRSRSYAVTWRR